MGIPNIPTFETSTKMVIFNTQNENNTNKNKLLLANTAERQD